MPPQAAAGVTAPVGCRCLAQRPNVELMLRRFSRAEIVHVLSGEMGVRDTFTMDELGLRLKLADLWPRCSLMQAREVSHLMHKTKQRPRLFDMLSPEGTAAWIAQRTASAAVTGPPL